MTGRSDKSADAFRTISEVAKELGLATHVLRFWESKFPQIKPLKRAGGRRYYRPDDVALLRRLQTLLHDEGYTIKGVQKLFREEGARKFIDEGAMVETETAPTPETQSVQPQETPVAPAPQASLFDTPQPQPTAPTIFSGSSGPVSPPEPYEESPAVEYSPDLLPEAPEPEPVYDPAQPIITAPEPVIQTGLSDSQKSILTDVLTELQDMKKQIDAIA